LGKGRRKPSARDASPTPSSDAEYTSNGSGGGGVGGAAERIYDLNIPAVVKFAYTAEREDELTLVKGSRVIVMEKCSDGWWRGSQAGRVGWFPSNYVQEELTGVDDREGDSSRGYLGGSQGTLLANGRAGDQGVVLHLVQTLYPFSSVTEEELNFEKGEIMEVIEKPENDPEWWRCKNSRGIVGLVPKNYVMVLDEQPGLPSSTSSSPQNRFVAPARSGRFAGRDWYYGNITRHQAECILNERGEEGDFLIRDSESSVSHLGVVTTE
ncbi:Cytoplasmic protein nck2, partial [Goodea atripinnis]